MIDSHDSCKSERSGLNPLRTSIRISFGEVADIYLQTKIKFLQKLNDYTAAVNESKELKDTSFSENGVKRSDVLKCLAVLGLATVAIIMVFLPKKDAVAK